MENKSRLLSQWVRKFLENIGRVDNLLSEASDNYKAYGVDGHRHLPEIEQGLADMAGEPVRLQSNFQQGLKSLPVRRV